MDAVLTCMVTDNLGPGSLSDQLTGAVGDYLGLAGGIALRERRRAFSLALERLDLDPGTGVVMDPLVPHSYHAALLERGLVPVYADVTDASLCIDPELAEASISRISDHGGPVGAIVTHTTLGFVPDMDALSSLGVPLIEDISEGIGGNTGSQRVGRFGRCVVVAMEPDGVITAGGGSLLLVGSKGDRTALRRKAEALSSEALLPDMNAALGLTQIKEIEKFVARRTEIASVYSRAIMRGRHRSPVQPGEAQNVHLTFPVVIEGSVADVISYARKKGVEVKRAFEASALARYGRKEHEMVAELASTEAGASADTTVPGDAPASRETLPGEEGGPRPGSEPTASAQPTASAKPSELGRAEPSDSGRAQPGAGGPRPQADDHAIVESQFPVARALLLRCLCFPLYPSLTAKEVAAVERVLTTLP
jgi:dTDP-4-amino-4,6-dideoxygalactose transaminase